MPVYLHESKKESVIRVYDAPDGYALRRPYIASLTVDYLTATHVYISNLMGRMSRSVLQEIKGHLKASGVQTLTYERHGKMRIEQL